MLFYCGVHNGRFFILHVGSFPTWAHPTRNHSLEKHSFEQLCVAAMTQGGAAGLQLGIRVTTVKKAPQSGLPA